MSELAQPKYRPCTLGELADLAGVRLKVFRSWLSQDDWIAIIRLGYTPGDLMLTSPVVKYLRDKFVSDGRE